MRTWAGSIFTENGSTGADASPFTSLSAEKLPAFRQLLQETGLAAEQVCFVGDDVPDLPLLVQCGLAVAVADACADVRAAAHYITRQPGGRGAVREVIELILNCQGLWQRVVERFRNW